MHTTISQHVTQAPACPRLHLHPPTTSTSTATTTTFYCDAHPKLDFYIQGSSLTLLSEATYNRSFTRSHADGGVGPSGRQPARLEQAG